MSIQTDLTRIKNAKAAIKAAIEGKGVTVPDATLLDGMAALIDSIEAGGGGGNITAGSITPLTANAVKVEHGLGATPQAVIFFAAADLNVISGKYDEAPIGHIIPSKNAVSIRWFCYRGRVQSGNISIAGTKGLWGNGTTNTNFDRIKNINDVHFMTPSNCDACTYLWVAFKEPLV